MRDIARILVSGGAGFIGSHIVDKLVGEGCEVIVLDNLSTGRLRNIGDHLDHEKVCFVRGDIRDWEVVKKSVDDVDGIIHLAAVTDVPRSIKDPVLTHEVNATGTLTLLRAACMENVDRFVFVSSCAVYGDAEYLPIDEDHPTHPISPYAASKLAAEHYCRVFQKAYGLKTVILRLFNVYGPRQTFSGYNNVITEFMGRLCKGKPPIIYGDGTQTRDFVHVKDIADAIWMALNNGNTVGGVFNLGLGKPTAINELAELLLQITKTELKPIHTTEPRPGDLTHSHADIGKAMKTLGYNPKITLEMGLTNSWNGLVNAKFENAPHRR